MFQDIQEEVNKTEDHINAHSQTDKDDIFVLLTHLLAECGEVADEVKGLEGKRAESPKDYSKKELGKELSDVIFNCLRIARLYNINLDQDFHRRMKGIRDKF
jgi:NTP pyrophosphatase (non-canonical NTP hydrolase)